FVRTSLHIVISTSDPAAPRSTPFPYTTLFRSKAPCGGMFVATARLFIRTLGQKYGPAAWMVPRESTTGDSVQYAPPSTTKSISIDRKSTRLNSSHLGISYAAFCLKKKSK